MKKPFVLAAAAAAIALSCVVAGAQEASTAVADASPVFSQMQPDQSGMVSQPIMHAPAGDVLAVYIGRTPLETYSKQDELLFVISGHGTAHVGYPSYALKPGSVVSIKRGTAFQIFSNGRAPIKAYLVASPYNDPSDKQVLEQ